MEVPRYAEHIGWEPVRYDWSFGYAVLHARLALGEMVGGFGSETGSGSRCDVRCRHTRGGYRDTRRRLA